MAGVLGTRRSSSSNPFFVTGVVDPSPKWTRGEDGGGRSSDCSGALGVEGDAIGAPSARLSVRG